MGDVTLWHERHVSLLESCRTFQCVMWRVIAHMTCHCTCDVSLHMSLVSWLLHMTRHSRYDSFIWLIDMTYWHDSCLIADMTHSYDSLTCLIDMTQVSLHESCRTFQYVTLHAPKKAGVTCLMAWVMSHISTRIIYVSQRGARDMTQCTRHVAHLNAS